MGEEKRMDTFESLARNHVELQVKPCASGVLCSALMYNADGSIVILAKEGLALGYFDYPMGTGEWKLHSKLEHWEARNSSWSAQVAAEKSFMWVIVMIRKIYCGNTHSAIAE